MTEFPNWFKDAKTDKAFERHLWRIEDKPAKVLQIGVYTGDATEFLLTEILKNKKSVVFDVDTWGGSDETDHEGLNFNEIEYYYDERHSEAIASGRLKKFKGTSDEFFKQNTERFDFIYIDGDHHGTQIVKDAINAWACLNINGVLAFDDYLWWDSHSANDLPKAAIDAWLLAHTNRLLRLETGGQVWIEKLKN